MTIFEYTPKITCSKVQSFVSRYRSRPENPTSSPKPLHSPSLYPSSTSSTICHYLNPSASFELLINPFPKPSINYNVIPYLPQKEQPAISKLGYSLVGV